MAAGSKKVIIAALIGNGLISITKFIAAGITGSSAMMSEGVHSLVDTGNQVLLLHGLKRAKKPADEKFPFGHGKEIYFWSFVVAILIFAVGAGISIYEGGIYLAQVTGNAYWDGVASVLIGCILGGTAIWLAYETKGLLIGERADVKTVEGIKAILNEQEGVQKVNEVLTLHMGPEFVLANISLEFADNLAMGELENIIRTMDRMIKKHYPNVKRVFIEAEDHTPKA